MNKFLIGILCFITASTVLAGSHHLTIKYNPKTKDFLTVTLQLKSIGPKVLSASSPQYSANVGDKYNFGVQPRNKSGVYLSSGSVAFDATNNDFQVGTGGNSVCFELVYTNESGEKEDKTICSSGTEVTKIPGLGANSPLTVTVKK